MNLKEYIFYSNITHKDMAQLLDVTPQYMRAILSQSYPISKKFAKNVEKVTHGMVTSQSILGPPTHPQAHKINNSQKYD